MRQQVLVVAGGTGTRMRQPTAKQFIVLEGLPLLWWTLRRFREALGDDVDVTLVLHADLMETWHQLQVTHGPAGVKRVVPGGAERFHSVRAGLATLEPGGVVGIHDAVRPFVSVEVIRHCFATAATQGCAVPAVAVKDSIRQVHGAASWALERQALRAVQTPQCFQLDLLREAYEVPYRPEFTDDASVFEFAGHPIHLVPGDERNIKLTTPEDLAIAAAFLRQDLSSSR